MSRLHAAVIVIYNSLLEGASFKLSKVSFVISYGTPNVPTTLKMSLHVGSSAHSVIRKFHRDRFSGSRTPEVLVPRQSSRSPFNYKKKKKK